MRLGAVTGTLTGLLTMVSLMGAKCGPNLADPDGVAPWRAHSGKDVRCILAAGETRRCMRPSDENRRALAACLAGTITIGLS